MLRLADREWPLSGKMPGGLAFKIARAEATDDFSKAMSLMLRMATILVEEGHARKDFEAFVDSDDFDGLTYQEINEAVAQAVAEAGARPTKKSSPSATGQTATRATSRDASTSPGTVTMLAPPERYRFGHSSESSKPSSSNVA